MRRKRRRRRRRETVEEHGSEWRHDLSAKKQQHKKQTSLENNRKPSKQEGTVGFCVYKRRIWPLPGESATREQRKVARRRKKNNAGLVLLPWVCTRLLMLSVGVCTGPWVTNDAYSPRPTRKNYPRVRLWGG